MSARDSFEFNTLHKGLGVRVLMVEFNELAVQDLRCRLKMLEASKLITRVDSTPLMGASWMLETFRHRLVFVRLREQHMRPDRSMAMEAFLAQLVSRGVTVIPIVSQRAIIDHFRRHLSRVSPLYLGSSFEQEDLLHILGACVFSRPVARRRVAAASVPRELSLAGF